MQWGERVTLYSVSWRIAHLVYDQGGVYERNKVIDGEWQVSNSEMFSRVPSKNVAINIAATDSKIFAVLDLRQLLPGWGESLRQIFNVAGFARYDTSVATSLFNASTIATPVPIQLWRSNFIRLREIARSIYHKINSSTWACIVKIQNDDGLFPFPKFRQFTVFVSKYDMGTLRHHKLFSRLFQPLISGEQGTPQNKQATSAYERTNSRNPIKAYGSTYLPFPIALFILIPVAIFGGWLDSYGIYNGPTWMAFVGWLVLVVSGLLSLISFLAWL